METVELWLTRGLAQATDTALRELFMRHAPWLAPR